ncbi:hypothetical protein BDW67DRAFT_175258 [Aspergillus spinulosporus]
MSQLQRKEKEMRQALTLWHAQLTVWVPLRSKHQCLYGNRPFGFYASSLPTAGDKTCGIRIMAKHIDGTDNPAGAAVLTIQPVRMLKPRFQVKRCLSPFQTEPGSLASYLHSTWITHALADLLVRSRLVMAALNHSDDAIIASVLLLAIHGFGQDAVEVHLQGLLQLIAARGGLDKSGFDGFLGHLIQGSLSFLTIAYGQPEPLLIPEWEAPFSPHTFICLDLDDSNKSLQPVTRAPLAQSVSEFLSDSPSNTCINSLLDGLTSKPDPASLEQVSELSKRELALSEPAPFPVVSWQTNWLKHSSGANMRLAVMGAAMSKDTQERASFMLKENCVVSSIKGKSRYVASRFCYLWLKERQLARSAFLEI